MLRLLTFIASFSMLVFSLFTLLDYWRYDEVLQDVSQLMSTEVTSADIEQQVAGAIAQNNPEDARMYLALAEIV